MSEVTKTRLTDVITKADSKYWKVYLQPAPDHKLAPYMDMPRVFLCDKGEAVEKFKKFYGIIATVHSFVVEPATEEEFKLQTDTDKQRSAVR